MAQQTINVAINVQPSEVSAAADYGAGESLHTLTQKCANNFADLLAQVAALQTEHSAQLTIPGVGALGVSGQVAGRTP